MRKEPSNILSNIDWITILMFFCFITVGWINIYAAAYNADHASIIDYSQEYGKQFAWIIISLITAFFILIIEPKFFSTLAYGIYAVVLILLILVLIIGTEVNGSQSWIYLTESERFQPSEFAKFACGLALAKYLGNISIRLQEMRTRITVALVLLVPAGLILFQNETGSVIIFLAFIFVLYREGLSGNILIVGFLILVVFLLTVLLNIYIMMGAISFIVLALVFFIRRTKKNILALSLLYLLSLGFVFSVNIVYEKALNEYQRTRIDVLLGKVSDVKGAGYNVNQSKIAIGSGGLLGKGFMNGTQTRFKFVPEQNTDFIFCTIGEEWGFLGTSLVLILYILFFLRLLFLAERQRSSFSRINGYSVATIIMFHVIINIGMTIGLSPVVGIPLPFVSYGGSSLLAFTILLFVFLKQDANRTKLI